MTGGPNWINSDRYDIDAKLEDSQIAALEKLAPWDRSVQVKLMVQSLLADRFKLVVNDDTTAPRPVYALVVAKGGPKLQETARCSTPPPGTFPMPPPPPPPPPQGTAPTAFGPATAPRAGGALFRPGEVTAVRRALALGNLATSALATTDHNARSHFSCVVEPTHAMRTGTAKLPQDGFVLR